MLKSVLSYVNCCGARGKAHIVLRHILLATD
jgi:hypothetical protein